MVLLVLVGLLSFCTNNTLCNGIIISVCNMMAMAQVGNKTEQNIPVSIYCARQGESFCFEWFWRFSLSGRFTYGRTSSGSPWPEKPCTQYPPWPIRDWKGHKKYAPVCRAFWKPHKDLFCSLSYNLLGPGDSALLFDWGKYSIHFAWKSNCWLIFFRQFS